MSRDDVVLATRFSFDERRARLMRCARPAPLPYCMPGGLMVRRMLDVLIAAGVLTFASLTLQIGLRLMAFHR